MTDMNNTHTHEIQHTLHPPQQHRQHQEAGRFGNQWHTLNAATTRINAVDPPETPLSVFERCCGLLVPLYAARATEEVFYGKEGVTTSTSTELSTACMWVVVEGKRRLCMWVGGLWR